MTIYYNYFKKNSTPPSFGIELMIGPIIIDDLLSDYKLARETAKEFEVEFKEYDLNLGKQDEPEQKPINVFSIKAEEGEEGVKRLINAYKKYQINKTTTSSV